jgi:hypothetical protein
VDYQRRFKPQITLWKRKEPNLKCWVLRFLTPVAGFLDALITICSFTLLISNFELEIVSLHTYAHFEALKKQKNK